MTVFTCASTGQSITLLGEPKISGEAKVWQTNRNGYLAKIYHDQTPERVQKLAVMIAHRPQEPNSHLNHISFAWPKSVLKDAQGNCVGFLMPEIKEAKELINIYNPQKRKALKLEVDWRFLHTTALNIASIIEAIHISGYVLGDIKQQNILVNDRALPSIIDTDSFQVRNPVNGKIYRCPVGSPDYTPPELIDKDFSSIDQTEVHDRFRLAVIIYQLLFGGQSPFAGKWIGAGKDPDTNDRIRQGLWLYAPYSFIQPVEWIIPLEIVHPEVRRCFLRCFNDGYQNSNLRPTAEDWVKALRLAVNELTICAKVDSHYYSQTYGKCYWCDRAIKLHIDIFPGFAKKHTSYKDKDADAYISSGIARYNLGDYQGAIDDYNQALKINPDYALAYSNRGSARHNLADNQGAIDDYTQALKINPNYTDAYINRGSAPYNLANNQGAIDDYNQALKINPDHALAYSGRGVARYILGDNQGAIDDYNQALKINPNYININSNYALAYSNRGNARYNLGDYQGAIDDYNQSLKINPDYALAYSCRGNARYNLGDNQGAIDDYNQALKINPNDAHAAYRMGLARSALDKQGAIDDSNQALKINPNDANAYNNRGLARSAQRNKQGAIITLSLIAASLIAYSSIPIIFANNFNSAKNSNLEKDYVKRCSVHVNLKDYSETVDDCNKAVKINPNNNEAYFLLCSARFHLEDYSEAVDDCNEAVNLNPNNDEAYFFRGANHIMNGNRSQGMEDLRKAASLGNESAKKVLKDVK
ncbi:tetratricopeptide repeat protein [Nostoc sp.]